MCLFSRCTAPEGERLEAPTTAPRRNADPAGRHRRRTAPVFPIFPCQNTPKPAALDVMSKNAQVRASSTRWLIMTDTSACQVGVYSGSYGNWSRVALWSCGPGKPSTPTVKGEFTIYGRGKSFGSRSYTCWYYTQFYGNYLFHSVLYNRGSMTQIQDGTLGKQVSHGCVRLDINNAKWLYDNIPNGTKVVIY